MCPNYIKPYTETYNFLPGALAFLSWQQNTNNELNGFISFKRKKIKNKNDGHCTVLKYFFSFFKNKLKNEEIISIKNAAVICSL